MDHVENTVHCCTPVVSMGMCLFAKGLLVTAAYTCLLRIHCLPMNVVLLFVLRLLPSNGSTHYSNILMTDLGRSQDSSVGTATGCQLDGRGVGIRVPVGARSFSSPRCPHHFWRPSNLLSNGYQELFPWGKADWAWNWPLTFYKRQGQEYMDLYIHSPLSLHGIIVVLVKHRDNFFLFNITCIRFNTRVFNEMTLKFIMS
jgi:hypothetical protein